MLEYNPFDKNISGLVEKDLQKLINKGVAEGWFVEYKVDFPSDAKKVAHSIAAFANTDGGWYIVGVKDNKDNVADTIDGFDLATHRKPKEKIRDIIKTHINPTPIFTSRLLKLSGTGTPSKAVLVVQIERGLEAPYVTSDGRVYRRKGEGADPVPETDHYVFQKLFERRLERLELIKHFTKNPFIMSQGQVEGRQSFLEAYFLTEPLNTFFIKEFYSKGFFDKLLQNFNTAVPLIMNGKEVGVEGNIFFSHILSSSKSYVLRSSDNPKFANDFVPTLEIFDDGSLKMFMPLPIINVSQDYKDHQYLATLMNPKLPDQFDPLTVIDAYRVFLLFGIQFCQYCRLLEEVKFRGKLSMKFKLTNTWRKLLYFDSKLYLDYVKKYGLPVILKEEVELPLYNSEQLLEVEPERESFIPILGKVFPALGVPIYAFTQMFNEIYDLLAKLQAKSQINRIVPTQTP